MVTKVHLLVWR